MNQDQTLQVNDTKVVVPDRTFYFSDRIKDIGLSPVPERTIEDMVENAYIESDEEVEYKRNPNLIETVGTRLIEELDLLIRLKNPESRLRGENPPDWYTPNEGDFSDACQLTDRTEFQKDFPSQLVDSFGIPLEIADAIVESMKEYVVDSETEISLYYHPEKKRDN